MQVADYYDSIAEFWDMDYSGMEKARSVASMISIPDCGGYALDIGCGSGSMILELINSGASEIEGVDISPVMVSLATDKFCFDPRIRVNQCDFLDFKHSGFDLAIAFNAYHHFLCPRRFVQKVHSLLREGGRLTVAYGFNRKQTNRIIENLPREFSRKLLPAKEEASKWDHFFNIDFLCDTEDMYIISGRAK